MTSASPNGGTATDGRPIDRSQIPAEPINVPLAILARHRAKLLDPAVAVRAHDGSQPLSTAYRADTLLVPAGEVESLRPDGNDYNRALEPLGVELRPSRDPAWNESLTRMDPRLPVPVPLLPVEGLVTDRAPDPWAALVALRRSFGEDTRAEAVGLEHLLVAASLTVEGAPVSNGGAVGGTPVSNGGSIGGGFTLYTGSRNPVALLMRRPERRPAKTLAGGRRPVVAVLDTGIGRHDWLTIGPPVEDPVVEIAQEFQDLIAAHEIEIAAATGAVPYPLDSPMEVRDELQPLLGLTDSHSGHGTFVAGLVHQLCPDARILALRLLHSDGYSTEGSLLMALDWLRQRVEDARRDGDLERMIDVVSLSLGFYPETAKPEQVQHVADAIDRLTELGVLVVAAAGNDATTRPFLPAAFGQGTGASVDGNGLLAAIGARNAAGATTAAFSNWGEWISRWAPGNALVSTVPVWEGAGGPGLLHPDGAGLGPRIRTAPDPDDLTSGFAVWAGTSFATPVVAGLLAEALAGDIATGHQVGDIERARRALSVADGELVSRGWL